MSVLRAVFGFVIYGVGDPWSNTETNPVLYTDAMLPTTGRPTELTSAVVYPIVAKRPGINWGADPRNPTGGEGEVTVTLIDDASGTLGTLFLYDPDQNVYPVEDTRLRDFDTSLTIYSGPTVYGAQYPTNSRVYYLGNEAITCTLTSGPTRGGTTTHTIVRGRCGSTARVHVVRPSEYSPGEDGTQDRILLKSKPDWEEGFYCGVYLFYLDELGAISDYVLRRGVVIGEPTPIERPCYEIKLKWLEDRLSDHTVGDKSKIVKPMRLVATEIWGSSAARLYPQRVSVLLSLRDAEGLFNEPLSERGSSLISAALVDNLNSRMRADRDITYELKIDDGDQWIFRISQVEPYELRADPRGSNYYAIKVSGTLLSEGRSAGATIGDVS